MAKNVETINFLKIRDVKSPTRGFPTDAGIDFYVPEFNASFIKDLKLKNPELFDPKPINTSNLVYASNGAAYSSNNGCFTLNSEARAVVSYELEDKNDTLIKYDEEKGENYLLLYPHNKILIPSGIKSRMSSSSPRALIASNKSGIASKHGVIFGAQVVDYSYQGEIHINVINTSTKPVRIYENMKLIQFIETPIFVSEIKIFESSVHNEASNFYEGMIMDRGSAGFGSTDKK
jgi:dUTPase